MHPVVEVESGFLLGSARGGKWLSPAETARAMHGGEEYRLYGDGKAMGTMRGGRPKSDGEPCPDAFVVPFEGPRRAKVAIAADWNALPRTPVFASTSQPAYLAVVREFLQSKGIKNPAVKLTQVIRVDLDGDGVEEVLLSATNYFTSDGTVPSDAPAGSYSFVLLRREVKGSVKTSLIAGEFYPKGKSFNAPASYKVLATLDCDGDGRMEIFVEAAYYEGGWTTVYRCSPKKIEEVVSVVCGA
ncbi:hypothetical protein N425_03250 [Tannerella sp. oral taxon BU063 isolate Cell 2]|uniref:Uncharacterized protein n=1 Tax=Tannerella sp. oral taxon BU063 isolate Cell 2 TaxID=1411148 RepID=W2C6G5_9BACT|nr:hypothetical protein N425_03250 [Tannerella sp. oral taxon BU063 isolate Cell 2]